MYNIKKEGLNNKLGEPALSAAPENSSLNHVTLDTSEAVGWRGLDVDTKWNHVEAPTRHVEVDFEASFCEAAFDSMDTSGHSRHTPTDADNCQQTPILDALPVWSSLKREASPETGTHKEHSMTLTYKSEASDIEGICSTLNHESDILGLPSNLNLFARGIKYDICHDQASLLGLPAPLDLLDDRSIYPDSSNDRSSLLKVPTEITSVHPKASNESRSSSRDHSSGLHLLLPDANQNTSLTQTHLLGLPSRLSSFKEKIYPSALDHESSLPSTHFRPSLDSHYPPNLGTTLSDSSDQSDLSTPHSINPQVLFDVVCFLCSQPVQKSLKKHLASSPSCRRAYIQANKATSSDSKPSLSSILKIKIKRDSESNRENFDAFYRKSMSASGGNALVPHKSPHKHAEKGCLKTHQRITGAGNSFNLDEITRVKCMICKDLYKSLDHHLRDNKRCLIRYQVKYGKKKFPFSCKEKPSTPSEHLGHMEQEIHVKHEENVSIKKERNGDNDEINVCVKEERNLGVKEEMKGNVPEYTRKKVQCNSKRRSEASDTKSSKDSSPPINSTRLNAPFRRKSFQFWGRDMPVEGTTPQPARSPSGASRGVHKHKWDFLSGSISKKASRDTNNPGHSSESSNPGQVSCASSCTKLLQGHSSALRRFDSSFRRARATTTPSSGTAPMSSSAMRQHRDLSHKEQLMALRMEKLRRLTEKKPPPALFLS